VSSVPLYDMRRRRVLVSLGPGYESHYTDGHGRLLCSPMKVDGMQSVLGDAPTCGWCFLIKETERNTRLVDSRG
jgi:hypothetical protein